MAEKELITLKLYLPVHLIDEGDFQEDVAEAKREAERTGGDIYTYHTSGLNNWLRRGISRVDRLAFVVLPKGLPDQIDMADDEPEPGDEE